MNIKYIIWSIVFIGLVFVFVCLSKKKEHHQPTLYERLGGIYAISAVVNRFSDKILENPKVGVNSPNPFLKAWSTEQRDTRLPGLKFMRTLWVADAAGGPYTYVPTKPGSTHLGLEKAHKSLHITSDEFNEVAKELGDALDYYHVPAREKGEVLAAFAAHKGEVTGCPFGK